MGFSFKKPTTDLRFVVRMEAGVRKRWVVVREDVDKKERVEKVYWEDVPEVEE